MAIVLAVAMTTASMTAPLLERPERPDSTPRNAYEAPPTADGWDGTVEYWRPLVEQYWDPLDIAWALAIIDCESGGDPYAKNPHSSASGLFQQLGRYWEQRAIDAGWAGASVFDPAANIAVSAHLYGWGGAGHWECRA